jgi:hypothetical protein
MSLFLTNWPSGESSLAPWLQGLQAPVFPSITPLHQIPSKYPSTDKLLIRMDFYLAGGPIC